MEFTQAHSTHGICTFFKTYPSGLQGHPISRNLTTEAEVSANADNLSLAVVDFENGGRSSQHPSSQISDGSTISENPAQPQWYSVVPPKV